MPTNDPKALQDELARKNLDRSEKKLTFDPTTGELVIKNASESERSGEVVVDQIYKDGFFVGAICRA